ncbi:MAG TPA: polysaccharide deacetylase family protein [Candidatus Acidoferrum sp.]|nr:polysaccharide deacetylase family protein [Candidatus Acidoferrum sp.]
MRPSVPRQFHTLEPFLDLFKTGVPILMYHKIGPRPRRVRLRGLYVRPEVLARQLDEFQRAGFTACPPAEANAGVRSGAGPARRFVLTFDDGFRNVFQNALEPLAQKKFHAIEFLVVNCIGKLNEWDLRDGEAPEPLMDAAQVREWLRAGHRIGSHSLSHPRLTRLSLRDALEEIAGSKKKLEDTFGVAVEDFSYPFGDWNEAVRDLVMEAGYRTACTTDYGVNSPATSPLVLRRIAVRHPTRSLKTLRARLLG